MDPFALITITVLAIFLGFEVVSKVSSTLHTPLMSEANAIHGIILLGAIMVAGQADEPVTLTLSIVAVLLATMNVVGGFVVTDRMLVMFSGGRRGSSTKKKPMDAGGGISPGSSPNADAVSLEEAAQ
ncbi:NAD(P) transhydrogenase subunit alpha [Micromonospora sp. DT81.3]|uniref:NAD(P) transhydrogenase subunit alpha n=1 Tax=Micromonospora sp. DT81.3 TaxID=3416523 RepID=UPI003CF83679